MTTKFNPETMFKLDILVWHDTILDTIDDYTKRIEKYKEEGDEVGVRVWTKIRAKARRRMRHLINMLENYDAAFVVCSKKSGAVLRYGFNWEVA